MFYIVSLLFLLFSTVVLLFCGHATLGGLLDIPSLFVVVITFFTVLLASDSVKAFFSGLKISASRKQSSALKVAESGRAVSLVIHAILLSALTVVFLCLAGVFCRLKDKDTIGILMALGLLTILYASEILVILLPVKMSLKRKLTGCKPALAGEETLRAEGTCCKSDSAGEGSLSQKKSAFRARPLKLLVSFISGFALLYLLLHFTRTFSLLEFQGIVLKRIALFFPVLIAASYIFLCPLKFFKPFITALKLVFFNKKPDFYKTQGSLEELKQSELSLTYLMVFRLVFSFFLASLFAVVEMMDFSEAFDLEVKFSLPLLFVAFAGFSDLFLLVVRTKIKRIQNYRIYGGSL